MFRKANVAEALFQTHGSSLRIRGVWLLVWGTWALMLIAGLVFVGVYGSNVPSWDGWDMVPTLTGHQPITAAWLWSQHNEHRVPVPRLILLGLNRITGIDFRVGMYFGVLSMGGLALAMILVARRLRGVLSYSDAFFPLVLLHWGHAANFLWGWQVQFFASTVLAGVTLMIIVQRRDRFGPGTAVLIGILLLLLPLCGGNGLALVPPLALWLGYAGVSYMRSREPAGKRNGLVILFFGFTALVLVALYFVGYENVPYHPTSSGVRATLRSSIRFLTIGLGPALKAVWPFSGIGVLVLSLLSAGILLGVVRNPPRERQRALGLFLFLGAMACLALAIGLGRDAFRPRYVTLAVLGWCGVYFVFDLYSPQRIKAYLRGGLFGIALIALWPNTQFGVTYAGNLRGWLGSFERDMVAGVPGYVLINRYGSYLHIHPDILIDYMPMLRRAGVGQFRFLVDDPPFHEIQVPLEPIALNQVRWENGTAYGTGDYPFVVFGLHEDKYVSGIRFKYAYSNEDGTLPYVSIHWKSSKQADFVGEQFWKYSPTGDRANWERGTWLRLNDSETTLTVWICDTIDQVRIHPDYRPGIFRISELVLLIPAND